MSEEPRTIAAIATAPGRGGVAVVRVSGPDAFAVAGRVAGRPPEPGRAVFARFRGAGGEIVDSGLLLGFASPRSYTGEDVAELQCHGGSVAPRLVLEACFAAGARLARRGEFAERAFLNGRMDLSEAEGVVELVDAKTCRAARDALSRQGGAAGKAYRALYDRALSLSATLEHSLDVDESELPPGFLAEASSAAALAVREVDAALARAREGRILRDGALVVLAGPPNAGKSSLLNALLGTDRAIVSPAPGTTRDSIEEWLDMGGWPVRLVDTAGLREAGDAVEREGVARAEALAAKADIVVFLDDGRGAPPPRGGEAVLRVRSKCDLSRGAGLNVSAKTGEGLDALRDELAARLAALAGDPGEASPTPSAREASLLAEARAALSLAASPERRDPVLVANAVRTAADALGRLAGAVYSDDLLDAVFSRFCVGK